MAQTSVSIRMDEETKKAFALFCDEIGLSVSTAFNLFAKTVVREQRIPFDLAAGVPNAETIAAMKECDEIIAHPEKYKKYRNVDNMIEDILNEV